MIKHLLILGASSEIAKALAKEYASKGYNLYLAGRNIEELKKNASNLSIRFNIEAKVNFFDVLDFKFHNTFYSSLTPKPTGVICAAGYLGNQEQAAVDFEEAKKIIDTNFTGYISILNIISNDFELRKQGFIVGISSIAGDRGRASNYIYGSSKAGLTTYLSGLRNRLAKSNVHVLTVKPGFVITKMTEGLNLPRVLTASAEEAAKDIFNAQQKNKEVIYTKWYWRIIMFLITIIPEKIFKKLNF